MQKTAVRKQQGFTLVEISVVMVIIGLLAAGILVGSSIMKSAELQKIASNFIKFRDATRQFHDKYKYFPGDFPEAVSFWGARDCAVNTNSPARETCDGDGNGLVGRSASSFVDEPLRLESALPTEVFYFWQHLTNAGFLEGAYTGSIGTVNVWNPGVNIPDGSDGAGYAFYYAGSQIALPFSIVTEEMGSVVGQTYEANYGHIISYGKSTVNALENPPVAPALSAASAAAIDTKIDDGRPIGGSVIAIAVQSGSELMCSSASLTGITYRAEVEDPYCTLFFITGL